MKNFKNTFFQSLLFILLLITNNSFLFAKSKKVTNISIKEIKGNYSYTNQVNVLEVPIVFSNGILFTYEGNKNDEVFLSGDFVKWKERFKLSRQGYGLFAAFLPLPLKKGEYKYRFLVNGIWINDEKQPLSKVDDFGDSISYFKLNHRIYSKKKSPIRISENKYLFVLRDNNYKKVHWLSSDNKWDPYIDSMILNNGYWIIEKFIEKSKNFYIFLVDDKIILDPVNENTTYIHKDMNVNVFTKE